MIVSAACDVPFIRDVSIDASFCGIPFYDICCLQLFVFREFFPVVNDGRGFLVLLVSIGAWGFATCLFYL